MIFKCPFQPKPFCDSVIIWHTDEFVSSNPEVRALRHTQNGGMQREKDGAESSAFTEWEKAEINESTNASSSNRQWYFTVGWRPFAILHLSHIFYLSFRALCLLSFSQKAWVDQLQVFKQSKRMPWVNLPINFDFFSSANYVVLTQQRKNMALVPSLQNSLFVPCEH